MRQTVALKKQYEIVDNQLSFRVHHLLPRLMEETTAEQEEMLTMVPRFRPM